MPHQKSPSSPPSSPSTEANSSGATLSEELLSRLTSEEQLLAQQWLEDADHPSHPQSPLSPQEKTKINSWKQRRTLRWIATGIFLSLALLSPWLFLPYRYALFQQLLNKDLPVESLAPAEPSQKKSPALNSRSELIRAGKWQQLHEIEPENPIWFTQAVSQALANKSEPPAQWQQTLRELDPDNAFLPLTQLGLHIDNLNHKGQALFKRQFTANKSPASFEILDAQRFEENLQQIYTLLSYPQYKSYSREVTQELFIHSSFAQNRYQIHPWAAQTELTHALASLPKLGANARYQLAFFLEAEASRAIKEQNQTAFLRAFEGWKRLIEFSLESDSAMLISSLVTEASTTSPLPTMLAGAKQFELTQIEKACTNYQEAHQKRRENLAQQRQQEAQNSKDNLLKWSLLSMIAMPSTAAILKDGDPSVNINHKPSVALERSSVFGSLTHTTSKLLLFIFLILLIGYFLLKNKVPQLLSKQALALINWQQWLSILSVAWLLPLLVFLTLRYLPGSSTLHLNFSTGGGMIADFIPLLSLPMLSLLLATSWMHFFLQKKGLESSKGKFTLFRSSWGLFLFVLGLALVLASMFLPHALLYLESLRKFINRFFIAFAILAIILLASVLELLLGKTNQKRKTLAYPMVAQCAPLILSLWIFTLSFLSITQLYESWYWAERDKTIFNFEKKQLYETILVDAHLKQLRELWEESFSQIE